MDARTKINGHYYSKKEMTDLLFALFKDCVTINNYVFKGRSIRSVITYLIEFIDVDELCIDEQLLKNAIASYCDSHDTGIYY